MSRSQPHFDSNRVSGADCSTGMVAVNAWPLVTSELPGIGGALKVQPQDFEVEEIPAYQPGGRGEFCYLWIEKIDIAAEQLLQHLADALQISRREIGTAGMKDRRAVTRQWVSVPASCEARVACLDDIPGLRVLDVARHGNKLKTGHLRGNRFRIRIRRTHADALARAQAIADIVRSGFPNYFGSQRFGADGRTLQLGLDLLTGRTDERRISRNRRAFLTRLALSAAQAYLFNECLADRLRDGLLRRVLRGDVMQVRQSRGVFVAEDAAVEQLRCDAGEIAVTGPMFGPKMREPRGKPLRREQEVLDRCGVDHKSFGLYPKLTRGTRRAYLVPVEDLSIEPVRGKTPDAATTPVPSAAGVADNREACTAPPPELDDDTGLILNFSLPAGCYATVLLREFQKTDDASAAAPE